MSTARNAAKRRKLAHKRAIGRVGELEAKAKEQQSLLGELTMRLEGAGGTSDEVRALRSETAAARALVRERDLSIAELSGRISDLELQVETMRNLKDGLEEKRTESEVSSFLETTLTAFENDPDSDLAALKKCLEDFSSEDAAAEIALAAIACAEAAVRTELDDERARADEAEAALAEVDSTEPVEAAEADSAEVEALEKRARDAETASKALAAARDEALAEVARLEEELEAALKAVGTEEPGTDAESTDGVPAEAQAEEIERLKAEADDLRERLDDAEKARDAAVSEGEALKEKLAEAEADSSLGSGQEELQQALADAQREAQNESERAANLQTMLEAERRKYKELYQKSFPLPSQEGVGFGAEVVSDAGKKGLFGKKKPFVIEAFCYHKDGRISVMDASGDQLPINQEKWNDN